MKLLKEEGAFWGEGVSSKMKLKLHEYVTGKIYFSRVLWKDTVMMIREQGMKMTLYVRRLLIKNKDIFISCCQLTEMILHSLLFSQDRAPTLG